MTREDIEHRTVLRCLVGSTAHGVAVRDGVDDRDEMGVCIETLDAALQIGAPFEQFIYRSAAEREGRQDARSAAGDLDLTIFGLRKYLRLALNGNPTVLIPLFAPPLAANAIGLRLRELAPQIVSRRAGQAFLGYMQAQKQRLTGERGQKRIHRPELEALYGFDTKYAMHLLRLGFQGVELMTTGRLTLPMAEPTRSWLVGLRTGEVDLQEALTRAGELEVALKDLLTSSPLPDQPETAAVEAWMCRTYINWWKADDHALWPRMADLVEKVYGKSDA